MHTELESKPRKVTYLCQFFFGLFFLVNLYSIVTYSSSQGLFSDTPWYINEVFYDHLLGPNQYNGHQVYPYSILWVKVVLLVVGIFSARFMFRSGLSFVVVQSLLIVMSLYFIGYTFEETSVFLKNPMVFSQNTTLTLWRYQLFGASFNTMFLVISIWSLISMNRAVDLKKLSMNSETKQSRVALGGVAFVVSMILICVISMIRF